MPQPQMLKEMKLNSPMKTYKTSRTKAKRRCPFHHRGLECKSRKSRDTWSKQASLALEYKIKQATVNRVLTRECTGQGKYPFPTTQETALQVDITRWWCPKYQNQIDYILCSQRWRSSIQSAKTRPGVDCGSDCEFLIAKFRLKLKEVGKTTSPLIYNLYQIPMITQWK